MGTTICPLCGGTGERYRYTGTSRQKWLAVYRRLKDSLGRPPSVRVLADSMGKSKTAAHYWMCHWGEGGKG